MTSDARLSDVDAGGSAAPLAAIPQTDPLHSMAIRLDTPLRRFCQEIPRLPRHQARGVRRRRSGRARHRRRRRRARATRALNDYTRKFDRSTSTASACASPRPRSPRRSRPATRATLDALELARDRIEAYHRRQLPQDDRFTDALGVELGWRWTAIEAVGLYVPGGTRRLSVLGADERRAGEGRRRAARSPWWCRAGRRAQPAGAGGGAACRRRRDLPHRRRAGGRGARLRHRRPSRRSPRSSGPATPMSPPPSALVFGMVGIDMIAGPSEVLIIADARRQSGLDRRRPAGAGRARRRARRRS